jgi:hypothetical protein
VVFRIHLKWMTWFPRALAGVILVGCCAGRSPVTKSAPLTETDRIVALWQSAQGTDRIAKLTEIRAHIDGRWNPLATAFDPVFTDPQFRISSDERYRIEPAGTEQNYRGPGGAKRVLRDPVSTHVWYNGVETQDADLKTAAGLAADSYRMLLLGPRFFKERHAEFKLLGIQHVDGADCDELSARIRPGLGDGAADTLELSIDRKRHLLMRIRMSPTNWARGHGKTVDLYLRNPITIDGVIFPSVLHEEILGLVPISVHDCTLSRFEMDPAGL